MATKEKIFDQGRLKRHLAKAKRESFNFAFVPDVLQAATGLDFGIPETHLVAVDAGRLADEEGTVPADAQGKERIGSLQHFETSLGEFSKVRRKDPGLLARIPKEEVQKTAVLDLVCLNMDRHAGNFMIGERPGDADPTPSLIPIDHGLALPSREGLNARRVRLGPDARALAGLPGSDEPFSPEMQ